MSITLITPTADQPMGLALLERYMARQSVKWDQWIVSDDGEIPATLNQGQEHIVRPRKEEGARSLADNLLAAIPRVTGDAVLIIEHDDWYAPEHIENSIKALEQAALTGSKWQRYYNVSARAWICMRNVGSALCNTAMRSSLLPELERSARLARRTDGIGVDRLLWEANMHHGYVDGSTTVVGIKGLPGRRGLGLGHRPHGRPGWHSDFHGEQLREWIGDDADAYLELPRRLEQ